MKRAKPQAAKLEAELHRLNDLVRLRRQQLARLEHCPHQDCECRHVWHKVVDGELASQVSKVGKHLRKGARTVNAKAASKPRRSSR